MDEIRIRFIVCLSFIKLNWWQAMDLAYYLFFLKRIEKWHIANLRRSSWTTGRIEKNERIKMIIKEKESERTTVRIRNWLVKENESPGRIRRTNMLDGIQMQKNKEIMSWLKNTWRKHRNNWITVTEMWGQEFFWNDGLWWKETGKQLLTYSGWVRKEYLTNGIIQDDSMKLEPRNFESTDKI